MIIVFRRSILLILFILQAAILSAQITITGKVTDADNGETIPGVSVTVGKAGTFTDIRGHYTLTINTPKESPLTITYKFLGYMTKEVTPRTMTSQTINVALQSDQKLLSEVVVNGQPYDFGVKSPQMGAVAVTNVQIKNLPVVFGEPDLLKTLQTTPGVQSGKSGNAGIMVRGGNFDQNNLMVDGASLYSSEHMRGFISAINPDIVSTLAFYRGAFPAKYSGRLSGIIDVSAKEGDFYNYHGEMSVGAAMGRVNVSGPILKGTTSFAVAARMSYFGLIYQKVVQDHYDKINQECPYSNMEFWDVNAKIVHKFSENDKLSVTFVKDHDKQDIPSRTASVDTKSTRYYIDKNGTGYTSTDAPINDVTWVGQSTSMNYSKPMGDETWWGNTLASMNYMHRWDNSDKNLSVTAAFSEYQYERTQAGVQKSENFITYNEPYDKIYNDSIVTSYNEQSTLANISKVRNLRLAATMNHPLGENNKLVYGLEFRQGWFDPGRHIKSYVEDYKNWSIFDSDGTILVDHRDEMTITDTDSILGSSHRLSSFNLFLSDEIRYNRFSANVGVNLALYKTPGKTYFYPEPRVAMSYMITNNTSIKGSVMQVSQAERLLSSVSLVSPNDIWVPATDSVPPMRSTQFGLSINHQFPLGIDLSIEGYYKTIKGNIDYLEGTDFNSLSSRWENQVTIGKSRSYGVEVLLQKFSGATNGWISYTWSRAFDKFDAPGRAISNGVEIPALADRPHNLSVNISQRWWGIPNHPRNHFDVSLLFKYMSGRRVTIPDHTSYSGMISVADHYTSILGWASDTHLGSWTGEHGHITVPSDAFDLYMRFNGYSQRYNYVLPYEMSLDMNISFTMCHRTGESKISVGATNILNRKNVSNVYMSQFADGKRVLVGVCDFPITPSISYTYSF
ncbi:MAG: TonB-dependent receptor plug domain-containing protein [Barnesiella sp.]|nr:TonB-dependent receptor plug domain-containing protein [Barnesiella sp.]